MNSSSNDIIASLNHLISGIKKHQPKAVFVLLEKKVTAAELVTILQSIVTALEAVAPAKGAYLQASRSADALLAQNRGTLRVLKQQLQGQGATNTELLADYGLVPRKLGGAKSPQEKAAAAVSAKATRAARHTMGKKQKAKITGATAAAVSAPSTTPTVSTVSVASPTVIAGNPAVQTAVTPAIPGH